MKTSNKILITTLSVFTLSYFVIMLIMLYSAKAEITKPYKLNGKIVKYNRDFDDNKVICLEGNLDVILKKDTVNKIEIEADKNLIPLINIENRYDQINIYTNNATYRNNTKDIIKIILHLKSFAMISGYDKVMFKTDSVVNTDYFNLDLWCGSTANLQLNTKTFNCNIGHNSTCNVSGKTTNATISLTKESSLDAKEFCIEKCNVNIKYNSDADINVKGTISKNVRDDSKLTVIGNPQEKN